LLRSLSQHDLHVTVSGKSKIERDLLTFSEVRFAVGRDLLQLIFTNTGRDFYDQLSKQITGSMAERKN